MFNENLTKTIQEIVTLISSRAEEVSYFSDEGDGITWFKIRTDNPQLLIGRGGENLEALNWLIKRITEKTASDPTIANSFIIDVNDYKKKKVENVKNIATLMAERARFFKSDIEVEPMSAYDRRIIHTFLSGARDVKTESVGEGRSRRVVIKYIQEEDKLAF